MNIVKLMVIIIYLIIGSALGIIIIPEIANDLGLQNSSFLKNHYVDGIIGSIFMFLIFGVFIRRVTNAIKGLEHFIMRRSAVETIRNNRFNNRITYFCYGVVYIRINW